MAAVHERDRSDRARDADLYAILCNLLAGGKKRWTRADFLRDADTPVDEEKARQAVARYHAMVAETEARYERERGESTAGTVEPAAG